MSDKSSWMDYIRNPKSYVLKKYIYDMIHERIVNHEPILERLSHYLVTENDIKEFGKLAVDIFEVAYMKAVEDHKAALAKAGLKVTVTPSRSQAAN